MCTITYFPKNSDPSDFIITQNRDESVNRPAIKPKLYKELETELYYPKDRRAGGTWIGISPHKRLISLMNGAFSKHKHNPPYRKSRGLVVKELLAAPDFLSAVEHYDFEGIEAFFALVFSWKDQMHIHELIWDGETYYLYDKDASKPALWSSAMMYSSVQQKQRKEKFSRFVDEHGKKNIDPSKLWTFHHQKEKDGEEGIIIQRNGAGTTSISQVQHQHGKTDWFRYHDLLNDELQYEKIEW